MSYQKQFSLFLRNYSDKFYILIPRCSFDYEALHLNAIVSKLLEKPYLSDCLRPWNNSLTHITLEPKIYQAFFWYELFDP